MYSYILYKCTSIKYLYLLVSIMMMFNVYKNVMNIIINAISAL